MKIQGRLIVILAVMGLLAALVPLASAGAVAGTVTLSGGEKGQYFSDQTSDNIVTISINDADLTPLRMGTARSNAAAGTTLDLTTFHVAGEKEITQRFDGGVSNPLCNHDNDDGTTPPSRDPHANRSDVADCNLGDAIALDASGNPLTGTAPDT